MAQLHYTAEVIAGLLLELPKEAEELHLKPGERVWVQVSREPQKTAQVAADNRKRFSALGKYAFVAGGSDAFAQEKQAEIEREDRSRG